MKRLIRFFFLGFLFGHFCAPAFAAAVVIPDEALKDAIWVSLGRATPVGILTDVDMLSLTNLDANSRNVRQLDGLGAAHNLTELHLENNQLTSLTLPAGLTSLGALYIDIPPLTELTLSKILAENNLKDLVENLRARGVVITLLLPQPILATGSLNSAGVFDFVLTGSPGQYRIRVTLDFSTWTDLELVTIPQSGSVTLTDPSAKSRAKGFYRAVQLN